MNRPPSNASRLRPVTGAVVAWSLAAACGAPASQPASGDSNDAGTSTSSGSSGGSNGGGSNSGSSNGAGSNGADAAGAAYDAGVSSGSSSGTMNAGGPDGSSPRVDGGASIAEGGPGGTDASSDASGTVSKLTGTVRIMPLGDSITGSTCWRARLWDKLTQNGHTSFGFVGSLNTSGDCSDPSYDGHNEGHGGYLVTDLVGTGQHATEPAQWFTSNPADIALVHFGTNDVWNNIPPATILNAYTGVVTELRKHSPRAIIVVAQLIAMNPVNTATCTTCACPQCGARVQALNAAIPSWAATNSTSSSPILVVDQWTGFDATADTKDGVHPNDSGSQKTANRWYDVLVTLF